MNAKQAKYPQLRFKGFTDPWEQRKLNNYLDVSKEKNKNNYYSKDEVLSVSGKVGIVNQIAFQGRSFAGASVAPYRVVHNGDVVYTKSPLSRNPFGIIKTNKGKTGIVSTLYAVYKPISNLTNTEFVQSYFELGLRMNKYMKPLVNIGAKHDMKVSDANALLGEVVFPSFEEQSKITKFLGQLDDLITLHQRKLAKLKKLKQGYLQKLFPKNGSNFPQLRFAGFADAWEQRSFKTLYKKVIEKNDLSFESDQIISVANMYYKPNDSKSDEKYMETYNIFRLGDIAFEGNKSKNFAYGRFVENTIGDGIVSHVFDVFRPISEYDLNYWKYFIHYEDIMGQKLRMSTTKATMMNNLVSKDFLKQSVLVPNLDEQQKIGTFFKQLDHLITLHQRKLEKLQELKKGYLQKMFC
ncbi:restriction endonuclease subunit S [Lactiplantibacillus plantarum]|uniref:restriction endonuclease subunit S n=1 Tax=Lactiplantibacillus plantarum TaxID=1590 RepID=UPI0021A62857|nr:restriction endonuclease subunit S [Lactiplantibacillus plantarum]MCT4461462.1 restriction endonuclease subunit S [Lactiplantibacillus plantarum]